VTGEPDVAAAAALLAEPSRAAMVLALMDGTDLPGAELASRAGIAASTASEHLGRLVAAGFVEARRSGRQRHYRLATREVAAAVEALAAVAPRQPVRTLRAATAAELLREARTCYDHLAGRLGVAFTRALVEAGVLVRRNGAFSLGPQAEPVLGGLGIDLDALRGERRRLVRGCLDWSERELHVAGALGAALADRVLELGWIERRPGTRSVAVTAEGRRSLERRFGIRLGD